MEDRGVHYPLTYKGPQAFPFEVLVCEYMSCGGSKIKRSTPQFHEGVSKTPTMVKKGLCIAEYPVVL